MIQGEILKGHYGTFKVFRSPDNGLSEWQERAFLESIAPGNGYGSILQDNLTWRCVSVDGRNFVVTTYSAPQTENQVGGVYQHVRYFEADVESLGEAAEKSLFAPFADETAFEAVAGRKTALGGNWLVEFRKTHLASDQQSSERPNEMKQLDEQAMADLVCDCLYRGMVGDYSGLVIFVPKAYTFVPATYLRCCRTVMAMIAACVPFGLRRFLRFATNPDFQGRKHFNVLFAPEGTVLEPGQIGFFLYGKGRDKLDTPPLVPELVRLIRLTSKSRDRAVLNRVYQGLERGMRLEELDEQQYAIYLRQEDRSRENLDWELLRQYDRDLSEPALRETDQSRIRRSVLDQLGKGTPDNLLREDPALREASSLKDLAQALSNYVRVLDVLDEDLGRELSATLLQQCLRPERELEALNGDFELLCVICSTQNREVQENAEASAYPLQVLRLLDKGAVTAHLSKLSKIIQDRSRQRESDFFHALPGLVRGPFTELADAVEKLGPCKEAVLGNCMDRLVIETAAMLLDRALSEEERRSRCEEIRMLLDDSRRAGLDREVQNWERTLNERRQRLDSMTSFSAYLCLGVEDEECEAALWEHLRTQDGRRCGLRAYQRAYEQTAGRAWPEMWNKRSMLSRFVEKYQMGIWIDQETSWPDLRSELLAYRFLLKNMDQVYFWYPGAGEGEQLPLEDVMRTIEFVRAGQKERLSDDPDRYSANTDALICLAQAGMLRRDNVKTLNSHLPENVRRLIQQKSGKKRSLSWRFIALVEGIAAILIISALSAALFLSGPGKERPEPVAGPSSEVWNTELITSPFGGNHTVEPTASLPDKPQAFGPASNPSGEAQSAEPILSPINTPPGTKVEEASSAPAPDSFGTLQSGSDAPPSQGVETAAPSMATEE